MTERRPDPNTVMVRYVSPFGSPAYMSRAGALRLLAEDDARWLVYGHLDALSEAQRAVGPPRIEALPR